MAGSIPDATFRLEHSFALKPDLTLDRVSNSDVVMGQNAPGSLDAIFLGKQAETPYRNVWMDTRGAHAVYVMGKRRSGKTYSLGVIAEGLAASGWIRQSSLQQGVLVLDSMNVFLTMPFGVSEIHDANSPAAQELRKWRLDTEPFKPLLFRPKGTSPPAGLETIELTLKPSDFGSEEWCGLFEADPFADPLGHLITELYAKVAYDGYTDVQGITHPPLPEFSLSDLLAGLAADPDLQRYHRDTIESLRRRLDAVRRLPLFSTAGLDIRRLLVPGRVTILLLRDLDQQMRAALVGLIVRKMMHLRGAAEQEERMAPIYHAKAERLQQTNPDAAREYARLAESCQSRAQAGIPRSWIIIDEAHNYIPARGAVASRAPLKKYVTEGRNLGLSIVVATQQPSGLDPAIQRNADLLLIHALSHRDDIDAAEGMINTSVPPEFVMDRREKVQSGRIFEAMVRSLPLGYAIASTDRANRLFPLLMRPRITVHGGTEY
ncbi:MAG: hypothetical protein LAN70_15635 [Acidobacteriia bacterium]|nr:hypothetical protein [Terriglobia bacterium]